MVSEPQEATRPSSRVSISPRIWINTSDGPMANPPAGSGTGSLFAEVYCDIEGGASGSGTSAAETAGGLDGSGALATMAPREVRATSGVTGGAAGVPGFVATQFARLAGSSCGGRGISCVSPFFAARSSVAGVKGCSSESASVALSATARMGLCCSASAIRSAIASLPALRNHSRARASSPFCASARPR